MLAAAVVHALSGLFLLIGPRGAPPRITPHACADSSMFIIATAGELALRPRTRFLAQRPFQIAFHEAPLGPVYRRAAYRHRARNLFVAAAGIGRQQYLGSLG